MIAKKLEIKNRIYNTSLISGKKTTTEKNLLKSLKKLQKTSNKNHIKIIRIAIKNSAPTFKMDKQKLKRRKKKIFKERPAFLDTKESRINFAFKIIVKHSNIRTETSNFYKKFSHEILDSSILKSLSISNKAEAQKQIILKKKFLKYRWKKL